jgi:mono/diheme cytochrome c family protein
MNQTNLGKSALRRLAGQVAHLGWRGAFISAVVVGLGAALYFVLTINVAATAPHAAPVEWALSEVMERSVRTHAGDVQVPAGIDLDDPELAARAIGHYTAACATCHAAPGEPRAPWIVMYPPPQPLTEKHYVDRWSDAELYWIIKHGIKDTGMIALGPTHQESDLWAVAAFVRQLPTMDPERYRSLRSSHHQAMPTHPH